ncbi:MAG: Xaa-Pro aminopeptidase, partial [Fulvivirga sp.]|nr:Xaa-Pro aminopeptidase [Fulvivirga sp.]
MFPAQTYINRRNKLRKLLGSGKILLLGNEESSINFKDNWYHFRQDSTFLYFFGINQPGLAGMIDCDLGEDIIFGDELTMEHIVWTGPQPTIVEWAEKCGITKTLPLAKITQELNGDVHYLPPYRTHNQYKLSEWLGKPMSAIHDGISEHLIKAIVTLRSYKTAEEVAEIEKAVNVTADMHLTAMKTARPGVKESEIVGKMHQVAISSGGNLSFPVICSKDGQILHNHYYGNTLKEGDLVLTDCGAETSMGYAGDMTRTYPAGTHFTQRQKELYQVVLDAHQTAVESLKPGISYKEVHLKASKTIAEGLISLGLLKGYADDAVEAGAHALFFQHGLGHMMGLDVHDMEDLGENYVGYDENIQRSSQFGLSAL